MNRRLLRLSCSIAVAILAHAFLTLRGVGVVHRTLLDGWWFSGWRLIDAWRPGASGSGYFFLGLAVTVAGTHRFLSWVCSAREGAEGSPPVRWRWKWTLCGFGMLACILAAICSLVLTTHQVYWISKSTDPILVDPFKERLKLAQLSELQQQAEELQWNTAKLRELFGKDALGDSGGSALEAVQPVWIENRDGSLRAVILVPRHPLIRANAPLIVLQPGTKSTAHRLKDLPRVLASLEVPGSPKRASVAETQP